MSELKPCPFCGKEGVLVDENGYADYDAKIGRVSCEYHHCLDWTITFPVKQWQSRPIEDALRARIAELEAALTLFLEYCDYTSDPEEDELEAAKGLWDAYEEAEKAARLVFKPEAE